MNINIRKLNTQDVQAVSAIEEATFSMPWPASAFEEMAKMENALYLVAEIKGRIAGCCGLTKILDEGNINNVVVAEAFRGEGVACMLLSELIRQGRELGIRAFTLEVRESNKAAVHVYEKLGFISEGIRPGFYDKPKENALIMWLREFDC